MGQTGKQQLPIRTRPLPEEYPGVHGMDEREEEAVMRVCRSKSLYRYYGVSPQHEATQFEAEFSRFVDVKHVLAVTSGTAALHVALSALGVGPGQEVIVPAYMWVSVIAAVVNLGAIPVLADIDETFCVTVDSVRAKITPRTSTIVVVHMSGAPADVEPIVELAREAGLFLVEDCAQCVGGTIHGKSVGTFGDVGTFSFQINKNMSAGEAGAVVTNHPQHAARLCATHDIGFSRKSSGELDLEDKASWAWGRGCRLDELRAAVLRVQLDKLPSTLRRLRASKQRIKSSLAVLDGAMEFRRIPDPMGDTGGFLITIFKDKATARRINQRLRWHGIASASEISSNTLLVDYGLHIYSNIPTLVARTPVDGRLYPWGLAENRESVHSYDVGACPVADDLFGRTQLLAIPSCLTERDEAEIIAAFREAVGDNSRG